MAGESNRAAVDPAIGNPAPVIDEVRLSASEAVRLRERAAVADRLEQKHSTNLVQLALAEATAGDQFASETARNHAVQLLQGRLITQPDHHREFQTYDRVSGRPAPEGPR